MTVYLNSLKEVANKQVYMAIVLYISHQTWGDMITEVSTVEKSSEDAETWVSRQLEAKAVVWHQIIPYHLQASVSEITTKLVGALEAERRHMQDEMAKQLTEMADRISNLKAITYEPEDRAKSASGGYSHSEKLTFVQGVIHALADVLRLTEHNPYGYADEEGEQNFHASLTDLFSNLWQCDQEYVRFYLTNNGVVTLSLVWDNDAPEVIADFSWPRGDEELEQLVANTLSNTAKEFGYE